jgi:hypothetical protein
MMPMMVIHRFKGVHNDLIINQTLVDAHSSVAAKTFKMGGLVAQSKNHCARHA